MSITVGGGNGFKEGFPEKETQRGENGSSVAWPI